MRKKSKAPVVGTALNLAEHTTGYAASGTSEWSRFRAARQTEARTDGVVAEPKLLRTMRRELDHLIDRLRTEESPERRAKLEHNVEIKTRFIATLLRQEMKNDGGDL